MMKDENTLQYILIEKQSLRQHQIPGCLCLIKQADSIDQMITLHKTILVSAGLHKREKVKTEHVRVCRLTQVSGAARGTLGGYFQEESLRYETLPWTISGIGEPAAAASSPGIFPPAEE